MDKYRLIVTETYPSQTDREGRENLRQLVDQHIRLSLKNSDLPAGARSHSPADESR